MPTRSLFRYGTRGASADEAYANTRSERLLMTSTDAKELVNLAERMGIPTEDAVHRVVLRMAGRRPDIKSALSYREESVLWLPRSRKPQPGRI